MIGPHTVLQFSVPRSEPVPNMSFDAVRFEPMGNEIACYFTVGGVDITNLRIPSLRIENVVAAMAEAARVAMAYQTPDIPIHDFTMTINRGANA